MRETTSLAERPRTQFGPGAQHTDCPSCGAPIKITCGKLRDTKFQCPKCLRVFKVSSPAAHKRPSSGIVSNTDDKGIEYGKKPTDARAPRRRRAAPHKKTWHRDDGLANPGEPPEELHAEADAAVEGDTPPTIQEERPDSRRRFAHRRADTDIPPGQDSELRKQLDEAVSALHFAAALLVRIGEVEKRIISMGRDYLHAVRRTRELERENSRLRNELGNRGQ